ncbi:MAG: hypothetical protein FWC47_17625, partial [Oscillospiraceae bacterium]|nr:hypothetical protein [Oscillospiraceae bacterium]
TQAPGNTTAAPNAVTSASPKESSDPAAIATGLSKDGSWIFSILSDVTLTDPLTVTGTFHDKDDATAAVYRKLALYAQDANHNVTANYTLTVPKITVNSPNFRIQNGTVKGDIYVNANGFDLNGCTLNGNLYFTKDEFKNSFTNTKGTITGKTEVTGNADAVAAVSANKESSDPAAIATGLSKDGVWIFSVLSNVTMTDPLTVTGEFHDKDDATAAVYRKLALYAQDDKHNVTAQFTLTVPKITVNSPNFRIQNGTVVGDIYVNANGFDLNGCTLQGNLYFTKQEFSDSFKNTNGTITGKTVITGNADAVTAVSPDKESSDPAAIIKGLSADGVWIFSVLSNVTVPNEIVVDGEFHDKGDTANAIYRKLALYTQDDKHNVTAQFTLTVPKITVNSENFRIQYGTVKGDIYVNANGFNLNGCTLDGNLYFSKQEYMDSCKNTNFTVTGTTAVQ